MEVNKGFKQTHTHTSIPELAPPLTCPSKRPKSRRWREGETYFKNMLALIFSVAYCFILMMYDLFWLCSDSKSEVINLPSKNDRTQTAMEIDTENHALNQVSEFQKRAVEMKSHTHASKKSTPIPQISSGYVSSDFQDGSRRLALVRYGIHFLLRLSTDPEGS